MQLALSILVIVITRIAIIYIVTLIEPFKVARLPLIILSFVWGIVSFLIADVSQTPLITQIHVPLVIVSLGYAPLLEEFLMMIFQLWLYHFTLARYSGDGMVYGFAVGSGFAFAESVIYVLGTPNQALSIALSRVVSVGLVHACIEGIVGAGVGGVIYYRRWKAYPIFFVLFLFAVIAHNFFNVTVLVETTLFQSITKLVVIGIISLGILLILQRYHRMEERWGIQRAVRDDLNSIEVTLLKRGDKVFYALAHDFESDESEGRLLDEYLITEQQIALLTRRVVHEKSLRPRIRKLREELADLKEKSQALKKQLSPEALTWIDQQQTTTRTK